MNWKHRGGLLVPGTTPIIIGRPRGEQTFGGGGGGGGGGSPKVYTYDFVANPSMPAEFSLARTTTGSVFNSSGVMNTAAINAARFEYLYNGTIWVAGGLLVESSKTNNFLQTNNLNSGWSLGGTVSTGAETAPDGSTAQKIVESAVRAQWFQGQITEGMVHGMFKELSGSAKRYITIANGNGQFATFNVATRAVTQNINSVTTRVRNLGNGWSALGVTGSNTFDYGVFSLTDSPTPPTADPFGRDSGYTAGGAGDGMNIAFHQASGGNFMSSYIPVTGSAVTRGADALSSNAPLTGYLAAGPSVWELTDLATGVTSRTSFAAGAFTFPVDKLYRSMAAYPSGTDTTPYLTVGGAY